MTLPTSSDIPRIAESLENTVQWLRDHGTAALRARHLIDEPEAPETISGRSTQAPNPTQAGALTPDWLAKKQLDLRHALGMLDDNALAVVWGIEQIRRRTQAPEHAQGDTDPTVYCAERWCEDPADPGRAGRCQACYQWRHRWSADHGGQIAPGVPRDVIAHRVKLRENRKVRVSGPMAGEVA